MWAAIIPIAASLIGAAMSAGDRAEADRIRRQILDQYGPEALAEVEKASQVGPSAMEGYQADPQAMHYQRLALARLGEEASTQGLTAAERGEMADAMDQTAQYEQGQRGAIMEHARATSTGGSGPELAAMLLSQQGGAMRGAAAGRDAASMAQRRRALANLQMGQMGGDFRRQGFDEFSAKARAKDAREQFNANARTGVKMGFLGGRAGALGMQAAAKEGAADDTQSTWAGAGAAGGAAAGSYQQYKSGLKTQDPQYLAWLEEQKKKGGTY
jgi:hypothetical protein